MKIGILTASLSSRGGGVSMAVGDLAGALTKLRDTPHVAVFGLREPGSASLPPEWGRARVSLCPTLGPPFFRYSPALLPLLADSDPDLLHVHGLWMYPSVACRKWSQKGKRPYIISPHGMLNPWAVQNSWWKKRLASWLYENDHLRGAACIHALCTAEADAIRRYGLRNPVSVIPNGVSPPSDSGREPPAWADAIPAGGKVLLYLGRLHPKKNLPGLLRAWRLIHTKAESEGWQLVLAGWEQGNHERDLKTLARELGIEQTVHFVGPQFGEQKDAAFRASDAFILPSWSEGLPVSVLEAWAYGLPVVMTAECNLPEGFAQGAALAVGTSADSIAEGLVRLMSASGAELAAMGQRGRQLVQERFCWPRLAGQMYEVYEWVLNGGVRPADVEIRV